MLAGWKMPASTSSATTASPMAIGVVDPPRKFQARPSWMSWASTTGLRAHGSSRVSDQAHQTSPTAYAAKNTAVVTPMVTRPELRLASSSTP